GVRLDPGTEAEVYRFEGVEGQRLFFDGLGPNSGGNWYLYGPGDEQLGGANLVNDFEVTLPQNGTYVLVLAGNSVANPVPYSVRVGSSNVSRSFLALGTTVAGALNQPGDQAVY